MLKSDENIIYLSKSVKISTKDVHATTVLCITPKTNKQTKKYTPNQKKKENMGRGETDKKRKENPAGKILGIISSPSWIRPENFVDITGDIFISKTTREEPPCMSNPSLNGYGVNLVTGLLHGLNEGHLSLGLQIIHLPPPRWEELLDWIEKWRVWWKV